MRALEPGSDEAKKLEQVCADIFEIFQAHNIDPNFAANILVGAVLMTAAHLDHPFDEFVELFTACLHANKAEFYDAPYVVIRKAYQ